MLEKPPVCDEWEALDLKDLELAPTVETGVKVGGSHAVDR
jgi:hypothetical protein